MKGQFTYLLTLLLPLLFILDYVCLSSCRIKFCEECQSDKLCSKCEFGFFLVTNQKSCFKKTCQDPSCNLCSSYIKCEECVRSYYLNPTSHMCEECEISHCLDCKDSISRCKACNKGYHLIPEGFCRSDKCDPKKCIICSPDWNSCKVCLPGYLVDKSK